MKDHRPNLLPNSANSVTCISAAAIQDATGLKHIGGSILLTTHDDLPWILWAGKSSDVERAMVDLALNHSAITHLDYSNSLILPCLVNAHAHLDLTHVGRRKYDGDFMDWVGSIRGFRHTDDDAIAASCKLGIEKSLHGGTGFIGDIAGMGSMIPIKVLAESALGGAGYLEVFGLGRFQSEAIAAMRAFATGADHTRFRKRYFRPGLQPHAPYSAGSGVYRAAMRLAAQYDLALCTHLSEHEIEIEFIKNATGPFRDFLEHINRWDTNIQGENLHPVDYFCKTIMPTVTSSDSHNQTNICSTGCSQSTRWIAAHVNYVDANSINLLAALEHVTVVYCPRASAYFHHKDHPYRTLLDSGVPVALGTDSMICLDTPGRISVLDEMRFLYQRDGASSNLLLEMATINGAVALGVPPDLVTFRPGAIGGLIAIPLPKGVQDGDPLSHILTQSIPPEIDWVIPPSFAPASV